MDSSLWPQRTVPKLPSGTNGCQTLKTGTLNTFYFCQKRPLCQPPPSPTPPPYSHFVRKVKLRLAYRLAFVKTPSTSSSIIISRKNSNIPFSPHDIGLWRKLQFLTIQVKLQVGQLVQIRTILPRGILLSWNLRQGGWSSTRNSCGRNVREVGPLDGGAPYTQPFWFLLKAGLPSPHLTMFFKCFKVIYHIIPISTNHIQPAPQLEKTQPSWFFFHTSLISPIRWPNCINAEAGAAINEVPLSTMAAQPSWQTSRSR